MTTPSQWSFDCITSWEDVWRPSFVEQWSRWLDESPTAHVFFHPALARAWVETYMPLRAIKPVFVVATCGSTTVFLPLVLWRRNWKSAWQRLLVPIGHSDYDYHDPIFTGTENVSAVAPAFWAALSEYLLRTTLVHFDTFVMDCVRSPSAEYGQGWVEDGSCPFSDLTPFTRPEDFLPSLKRNLRNSLRRRQHRIAEVGELVTTTFAPHQTTEALLELPAFLQTHSRRWPNAHKAPHFHENMIRHGLPAGLVCFHILRIGNDIAAWSLGLSFHGRYYAYMPAMIDRFANLSPGKMIMLYQHEQAIARGDKTFDHLRGNEEYKEDWATGTQTLSRFEMRAGGAGASIRNAVVKHIKPMLANKVREL